MSDTNVEAPAPPELQDPLKTAQAGIQAQINSLPEILKAQEEFGPQFSQQQLEQLKQFGPEFAKQSLAIQDISSPEVSAASKTLQGFLQSNDEEEFQDLLPGVRRDVRAAQSQRGIGDISPLGSIEETTQIQQLRQNLKNRRLNIALSTSNRQPISGIQGNSGVGQLVQNVNPSQIFGAQASNQSLQGSIFSSQMQAFQNQPGSVSGQILGGLGGAATGAAGSAIGSAAGAAALGLI
jgi:hypothetical protein